MKKYLLTMLVFAIFGALFGAGSAVIESVFGITIPRVASTVVVVVLVIIGQLIGEFRKAKKIKEV